MKSKIFNLSSSTTRMPYCIILFLFGMVLVISPAYTETPGTGDSDTKTSGKTKDKVEESDKPEKPDTPEKPEKSNPEDFGDGEPENNTDQDDESENDHPVIPELKYETYVELARVAKLDEKQQKRLVKVQKKRELALGSWDRTNEKKLKRMNRKASKEKNDSLRKKLEAKIVKFEAEREKLAANFDARARKVCKRPQLIVYNTEILYRAAMDEFDSVELLLSDEEASKVKKAAAEVVKKRYRSHVADLTRNKKIRMKGIVAVARKALTKKQFNQFKKVKMQEEREKRESKRNKYRK